MQTFTAQPIPWPDSAAALRQKVRDLIASYPINPDPAKRANCWAVADPAFSKLLGDAGLIGMTWSREYGGHERSSLERYVVLEELLASGAPVGAHWIADRQTGGMLLNYGQEEEKRRWVPGMARGEVFACIGLSEPNSGSDLASVKTTAQKKGDRWVIDGQKVWTTGAHFSHVMIALVRTTPGSQRNEGLSQFVIPMDAPGVTIRPIIDLTGGHDFNEVVFDDAFLPDSHLIGEVDMAWKQATDELAYERSGPDRWIETFPALVELVRRAGDKPSERLAEGIGREVAHLATLRRMSLSVAGMLQAGKTPAVEAAVVKDLGTNFEQALPDKVRLLAPQSGDALADSNDNRFEEALRHATLIAPKLTIQGGTREVLRGIIARGLGLR